MGWLRLPCSRELGRASALQMCLVAPVLSLPELSYCYYLFADLRHSCRICLFMMFCAQRFQLLLSDLGCVFVEL